MKSRGAYSDDLPGESPHYIRAVTEMGDKREVMVAADIYASNGIKLLAKGARIDSLQYERLTRHRLSAPLDSMLTAERLVDATALVLVADKVIEQQAVYRRIVTRAGDQGKLKYYLGALRIPKPVMLRLTVMSEQHKDMYQHSLRTAILAFALAQRIGLPSIQYEATFLAALCHDFGEMHTDPVILDPNHSITPEERCFVHVHPITGYVLLHEMAGFPLPAALAVLQHHERLDGSGYPYAQCGERIGTLGQLVGIADVAEAALRRFELPRVDMLFRINHMRFPRSMLNPLRDLLHVTADDVHGSPDPAGTAAHLAQLAELLRAWFTLRALLERQIAPTSSAASPLAFLFERMACIRSLVLQAGLDPDNMANMLEIAQEDTALQGELRFLLDEMDWLLRDLANEFDRRSPELTGLSQGALKDLLDQLRHLPPG
jgi:HD-GYP domain-containing protein (c-di-GMP phosphodiesterase class II)